MANVKTVAGKDRTVQKKGKTSHIRAASANGAVMLGGPVVGDRRTEHPSANGAFPTNGHQRDIPSAGLNGHSRVNGHRQPKAANGERACENVGQEIEMPEKLAHGVLAGVIAGAKMISPGSRSLIGDPAMLKPEELVEYYDPEEPANAIAQQLSKFAAGRRFLIFDDDTLNRHLSKTELQRLLRGFPDRPIALYNELPYETFVVGKRPRRYTDQSPWDGSPLYNGESNAGVKWVRLPRPTRRLLFIASQLLGLPELQKFSELELFRTMAKAEAKRKCSSFVAATALFPAAFIQFKDLERQDHLPPLKTAVDAGA